MPTTRVEQGALTVIVEIAEGKYDQLNTLLSNIGKVVDTPACPINFRRLETVHFMRWVILPESKDTSGNKIGAQLTLSTNYDLAREQHLRELVCVGGSVMEEIYSHCVGYSQGQDLYAYLTRPQFNYTPAAFYVGTPGLSVNIIAKERKLREEIERFLDRRRPPGPPSNDSGQKDADAKSLRVSIQAFVLQQEDLRWASKPEDIPPDKFKYYVGLLIGILVVVLAAFLAACVFVPLLTSVSWWVLPLAGVATVLSLLIVAAIWYSKLRADESAEQGDLIKPNVKYIEELVEREDRLVQNQLTHLVNVKQGWLRWATLWVVLMVIDFFARTRFVHGSLNGIPTIHFARWIIIDRGRRLLFFSNYDGSWVNYLGDFIDKAAPGLTAIWSNTVGCPKARRLAWGGATDEQHFKSWTRDHQLITQVWYSAYEDLTVDNINNNHKLRIDLFGELTPAEESAWLSLL